MSLRDEDAPRHFGFILRPTPDLFDVAAWHARLAELEGAPQSEVRDGLIECTKAHIAALKSCER